ncbi:MAG: 7TM diverse intracellular signaling domain-containing protein [Bacteroidota bacterium]
MPLVVRKFSIVIFYLSFLVNVLGVSHAACAAFEDPAINCREGRQTIGRQIQYYKDVTGKITIEDLLVDPSYNFQQSTEAIPNLGGSTSPFWIRFPYKSVDTVQLYLEIKNSTLQEIDFYVVHLDSVLYRESTGLRRQKSAAENRLAFWLMNLPRTTGQDQYWVYVRLVDFRRVILPLYIGDIRSVMTSHERTDFIFGIYFGLLLIVVTINMLVYIFFREKLYLIYVIHLVVQILINGTLKGYILDLAGPSFFWISNYIPTIASLSSLSAILFSVIFLGLENKRGVLWKINAIMCVLPGAVVVLNVSGLHYLSALLSTYSSMVVCIWLFVLGIVIYRKYKAKHVRFYLAGWSFFFVGLFILNMSLNGWIQTSEFTLNAAIFGSTFEVLLLTLALADRIDILRREHENERSQRLQLMEEQTNMLEQKVFERTAELAGKNSEIEAQNEELKQQHEELVSINDVLDKQNQIVEAQKKKIESVNQALELKVQERTYELEETVKNLIRQNHDLEQFSYIVSHNMRAPVARMLGLLSLLDLRAKEDKEYEDQLLRYLKDSAVGLDQIIQDLKQIVDMRKGLHTVLEEVDVSQVVQHILTDLDQEIQNSGAKIVTTLKVRHIISVKSYLQSILYNLISNALKYRSNNQIPRIEITTESRDHTILIEVRDNGLGIDLPPERLKEIFNLYKRMHVHVEGKGLGLYLVKTQVQALQGHVSVETKVNVGTTFRVELPVSILARTQVTQETQV